jgi:hypothetical protein
MFQRPCIDETQGFAARVARSKRACVGAETNERSEPVAWTGAVIERQAPGSGRRASSLVVGYSPPVSSSRDVGTALGGVT